jgi:glutamate-1-semialdehyde aminotransferase
MDYRWEMVNEGIMMVPKNARRNYITDAHDDEDARRTIEAAQKVLSELGQ